MTQEELLLFTETLLSLDSTQILEKIPELQHEEELFTLIDNYNWDDGFDIPNQVIEHPKCTQSVSLLTFYRADGLDYLFKGEEIFNPPISDSWELLVKKLYCQLISNYYPAGSISVKSELTKVQQYRLEKLFPELDRLFIDGIS